MRFGAAEGLARLEATEDVRTALRALFLDPISIVRIAATDGVARTKADAYRADVFRRLREGDAREKRAAMNALPAIAGKNYGGLDPDSPRGLRKVTRTL